MKAVREQLFLVAVLAVFGGAACAKGADAGSPDGSEDPGPSTPTSGSSDGGAAGSPSAPLDSDAAPADDRDPCSQGEMEACTCTDTGTEGQRLCVYDAASPLGGFFGECNGCSPSTQADGCEDGTLGDAETDVDCGGPDCPPCDVDQSCTTTADCASGTCEAGTCKDAMAGSGGSGGTGGTSGAGGSSGTGGTTGTGGTGGTGGSPPPPPPPPPPMTCTSNPSLCTGLLACCKGDGTCGTGVAPLCF